MIPHLQPDELLALLRCHGADLFADGDQLRFRARAGALPADLKAEASRRRAELLIHLSPLPSPPLGARLFLSGADGRHCWADDCHMWTWEGAPRWFYASERPLPPHEPAVAPHSKARCKQCTRLALRVLWQTCAGGERRLRCECSICGGYVAFMKLQPDNPDLEWRTVA